MFHDDITKTEYYLKFGLVLYSVRLNISEHHASVASFVSLTVSAHHPTLLLAVNI